MATAVLQKLEDLTECSICCGTYNDPRQLPCLHSFCLKCLQVHSASNKRRSMSCPLCRKETKLPRDGIKGFPRNFFIEKIMEIKRLSGPVSEATKCDVCFEDEEIAASLAGVPVASMYCTNCHHNLCTRCTKEHRRHMKTHYIVELGCDQAVEPLAKMFATSYCSSHPQDMVRMFCLDCNVVICFICFAEEHQMHRCSDINKEAEVFRKQIESDIKGVSSCLSAYQESVTKMEERKNSFLKQIETVEEDIFRRSNHLKEIIERDTEALLDELKSIKSSQLKEICMKTEEHDRCVTLLNSFKIYGEEMIALGSAGDVCRSFNQFHNRYDEIQETFKEPPFQEFLPKSITLKTRALNEIQQKNLVGRIEDLSCKNEDASDCLHVFLSMNFCEEFGRLKEVFEGSRGTQEWQDFPFGFEQKSEIDESLFVISIYTLMADFTVEKYKVPEGIDVDNLAAVVTGSVTPDKTQLIAFERSKRTVTIIGSQAQVAVTKGLIELMAGENLLPEDNCQREDTIDEKPQTETDDDDYNEKEFLDEDDGWRVVTHSDYRQASRGKTVDFGFTELPSGRRKKSEVKHERESEKKSKLKYKKACHKEYKQIFKNTRKDDGTMSKRNKTQQRY